MNIVVIMGGPSSEHEVSLASGAQVAAGLREKQHEVQEVVFSKDVEAFQQEIPEFIQVNLLGKRRADLVFTVMHGEYGEDGRMQALLEMYNMPHTNSGATASALAMHKNHTAVLVARAGLKVPKEEVARGVDAVRKAIEAVRVPCVVKPLASGSSVGVTILKTDEEAEDFLQDFTGEGEFVVQQFIEGREMTCAAIGNAGSEIKPLPPLEIIPKDAKFFDYKAKYTPGASSEEVPTDLSEKQMQEIQRQAVLAHRVLGCSGLSRSDFILMNNEFYFLETNTIPGMTETSLCPKEAAAAGMSFADFVDTLAKLALK